MTNNPWDYTLPDFGSDDVGKEVLEVETIENTCASCIHKSTCEFFNDAENVDGHCKAEALLLPT